MTTSATYDDVERAAKCIEGHAHRTPVITSRLIDEALGIDVVFKCENFQRTGAFKFRGAFNALSQFTDEQREAGVVSFSSGNHAQAIALAGRLLDIPVTVVMPHDAPMSKVTATKSYGGEVVIYDRHTQSREQIAAELAGSSGRTVVPSFDHPHILAGQGTAAKELLEDAGHLDALFVPLSGGGLLSGSALAVKAKLPDCKLYGVEPEAGNDGQLSLRSGSIVRIDPPTTIADGATAQALGKHPFEIIRRDVADVFTVDDAALVRSMAMLASRTKIVAEPTGCLGLAGLEKHEADFRGQRVGVIISGGNVDLATFGSLLLESGGSRRRMEQ